MKLWKDPEVLVREEEDDRYLLFNRKNQSSLILNNTAFFIWSSCDGCRDTAAITEALARQFDIAKANLTEDQLTEVVDENVAILEGVGFLREESPAAG